MASPLDKLKARIAFVKSQSANLRPAVRHLGQAWRADRKTDFASQGATTMHGRWQANKASTIKRKGHSMVLRGVPSNGFALMNSIIKRRHVDHIFRWTPGGRTIELGTKDPKARIHQLGLGGLPIRRPIDPTLKQRRHYSTILAEWIFKGKLI
jgi:hypothetical protein